MNVQYICMKTTVEWHGSVVSQRIQVEKKGFALHEDATSCVKQVPASSHGRAGGDKTCERVSL